jgi:hypothetical protein
MLCRIWNFNGGDYEPHGVTSQKTPSFIKELGGCFNVFLVFKGKFKVNVSLTRLLKLSRFVWLLLKIGVFPWFNASALSVIGEWSEDMSKHDFAKAKSWGMPSVAHKSTRSSSLSLSDVQYVGSPVDRCFKLLLSIVSGSSRPLNEMSLHPPLVCFAS